MPVEIVNAVAEKCKAGKLSKWMAKLKADRNLSCTQLGEAVAAMVENKRKSKKAVAGESEKMHGEACYLQVGEGGNTDDLWVRVIDPETRIRNVNSGKAYLIDELAHASAVEDWVNKKNLLMGHVNHKKDVDNTTDINVEDVRYDFGDGLFFKLNPKNQKVREGLANGSIRPSIEVDYFDIDVEDDTITKYYPYGLGLMDEGKQLGLTVGPASPDPKTSFGQGGNENMPEDKKNVGAPPPAEPPAKPPVEEIPPVPPKEEPKTDKNKKKDEEEPEPAITKEKFDELMQEKVKLMAQIEELSKIKDDKKMLEESKAKLEKIMIDDLVTRMPKGYKADGKSLERVQEDYELFGLIGEMAKTGIPKRDIPPMMAQVKPVTDIDDKGRPTAEWYEKVNKKIESKHRTRKDYSKTNEAK